MVAAETAMMMTLCSVKKVPAKRMTCWLYGVSNA